MSVAVGDAAKVQETGRLRGVLRSPLLRQKQAVIGLVVLFVFIVLAIFSPLIVGSNPAAKVGDVFEHPSSQHVLGTDGGGADMLKLLIAGTRISLLVGVAAALVSGLIGGSVGLIAGYYGGKTDGVLMRITDYFLVMPDVPLMIIAAALFGRSLLNIIIIIGVIYWTSTARIIRAQVKSIRERGYVKRAQAIGASNRRTISKHVLPQVTPLLIANTVLFIAYAIFAETFIAFLGLGDPSAISWGRLIENAFVDDALLNDAWWAIVPPGVAIMIVVLACTMVGQSMEDTLNPRLRVGHLAVRRFRVRPLHGKLDSE
jgi:peptide/nickel transport system permease protein